MSKSVIAHEAHRVPADLWHSNRFGETLDLAREPAKAIGIALFRVLEEDLEPDAYSQERDRLSENSFGQYLDQARVG